MVLFGCSRFDSSADGLAAAETDEMESGLWRPSARRSRIAEWWRALGAACEMGRVHKQARRKKVEERRETIGDVIEVKEAGREAAARWSCSSAALRKQPGQVGDRRDGRDGERVVAADHTEQQDGAGWTIGRLRRSD